MISLALVHQFYLVKRAEHGFGDYACFINSPEATKLHDDLVDYMWDTVMWIPTFNPASNEHCAGLNRWGPTVITSEGALQAIAVFGGWARIFSSGPTHLQLRGPWTWTGGAAPESGRYDPLRFQRDEVLQALRRLESYATEVARAKGELYMLHLGV